MEIITMRAVVCHKFGTIADLSLERVASPSMGEEDVRIQVRASGVSFATGLVIAGKYQRKPPLPFTPGTEVAGEIIEVGTRVKQFRPGEHVFASIDWGGWAEEVVSKSFLTHAIPDGLSYESAALLPISYPTSYAALIWKAKLRREEWVLVHGASGAVGLAAVEIAKAKGARVIATASTAEKLELATAHGADFTINYDDLRNSVNEITKGHGADVVFDPVGGDIFVESLRSTAREGRLITVGYASGVIPKPAINLLLVKNMSILGLNYGTYIGWSPDDDGRAYLKENRAMHEDLRSMIEIGKLRPIAKMKFPLEEFVDAYQTVQSRQSLGKVILEP